MKYNAAQPIAAADSGYAAGQLALGVLKLAGPANESYTTRRRR